MQRRQFLRGVIATGAAALGAATLNGSASASTNLDARTSAVDTEAWLLSTGRRALTRA